MKISYNWLQSYFKEKLPEPSVLGDLLTMHSFEVEEIVSRGNDFVLDIDILPNRGHDCLCHYGVAKEVSAVTGLPLIFAPLRDSLKSFGCEASRSENLSRTGSYGEGLSDADNKADGLFGEFLKEPVPQWPISKELSVEIQEADLCSRYSALLLKGVKAGPSPAWLSERLQSIGQKSINSVVDATNYVMFNLGQPLHAFDFARIEKRDGKTAIAVRLAAEDETITTLDGGTHTLTENNLILADGNADAPLAIAGVKGGMAALIDETTTDIILEAANFNRTSVRKTARALTLRTDASVRFEHEISSELTLYALRDVAALIKECAGGDVEGYVDVYPAPEEACTVSVSLADVHNILGAPLSLIEAETSLRTLGFSYIQEGETFTVDVPFERLDLRIKEDMVEEIGRVHGYEQVAPLPLPPASWKSAVNKTFFYAHRVRRALIERGFSEVYTYVFVPEGEVELLNPLSEEKRYLRGALSKGLSESRTLNVRNADVLGLLEVKIFELGKVFKERREADGSLGHHEHNALGMTVANTKKSAGVQEEELLVGAIDALSQALGIPVAGSVTDGVWEVNFDECIAHLPEPTAYEFSEEERKEIVKYAKISPYPFAIRDIALWTPHGVSENDVRGVIREQAAPITSGEHLLATTTLFDIFTKAEKTSYAFRLVFQSRERTLTDAEVNIIMERITLALNNKGWQVR